MTPKEYLMQYRDAARKASAALNHLEELRAIATRITPNYSGSGGSHAAGDRLGEAVARIVDAENRVSDEIDLLEATEREVIAAIDAVADKTLRTLLYQRYINGKTWEQIAVSLHYTYRRVTQLHGAALLEISRILSL